jgi:hypothetical protein
MCSVGIRTLVNPIDQKDVDEGSRPTGHDEVSQKIPGKLRRGGVLSEKPQ